MSYQCLVIFHTCVYSEIAGSSAIDLEMLFFCANGIILMSKKRSCLRHHLDCMWRSCWLASVACVGLFSSAYPIVIVLLQSFVS